MARSKPAESWFGTAKTRDPCLRLPHRPRLAKIEPFRERRSRRSRPWLRKSSDSSAASIRRCSRRSSSSCDKSNLHRPSPFQTMSEDRVWCESDHDERRRVLGRVYVERCASVEAVAPQANSANGDFRIRRGTSPKTHATRPEAIGDSFADQSALFPPRRTPPPMRLLNCGGVCRGGGNDQHHSEIRKSAIGDSS